MTRTEELREDVERLLGCAWRPSELDRIVQWVLRLQSLAHRAGQEVMREEAAALARQMEDDREARMSRISEAIKSLPLSDPARGGQ